MNYSGVLLPSKQVKNTLDCVQSTVWKIFFVPRSPAGETNWLPGGFMVAGDYWTVLRWEVVQSMLPKRGLLDWVKQIYLNLDKLSYPKRLWKVKGSFLMRRFGSWYNSVHISNFFPPFFHLFLNAIPLCPPTSHFYSSPMAVHSVQLFLALSAVVACSPKDSWVCWGSISFNVLGTERDAGGAEERGGREDRRNAARMTEGRMKMKKRHL